MGPVPVSGLVLFCDDLSDVVVAMQFQLVLHLDIFGLPGSPMVSTQVADADCPWELPTNSAWHLFMILSAVQKDSSLAPEWITTVNVDITPSRTYYIINFASWTWCQLGLVMDSRCRHIIIFESVSYLSLTLLSSTACADSNPRQDLYSRLYLDESWILFKDLTMLPNIWMWLTHG